LGSAFITLAPLHKHNRLITLGGNRQESFENDTKLESPLERSGEEVTEEDVGEEEMSYG
jgi:hypothetical protein